MILNYIMHFISINNLISASKEIGEGNLNTKVPNIIADKEIELLNKNFNLMIIQLKVQQEKLVISERHQACEHVARKLAHEIKNPLTPILLSAQRLRNLFLEKLEKKDSAVIDKTTQTIIDQVASMDSMVSAFAN